MRRRSRSPSRAGSCSTRTAASGFARKWDRHSSGSRFRHRYRKCHRRHPKVSRPSRPRPLTRRLRPARRWQSQRSHRTTLDPRRHRPRNQVGPSRTRPAGLAESMVLCALWLGSSSAHDLSGGEGCGHGRKLRAYPRSPGKTDHHTALRGNFSSWHRGVALGPREGLDGLQENPGPMPTTEAARARVAGSRTSDSFSQSAVPVPALLAGAQA